MRLDETVIVNRDSINVRIILQALLDGHIVNIKDTKYVMVEKTDNGVQLCMLPECDGEDIVLGLNITLSAFIEMCEAAAEDELAIITMNLVLNTKDK
jgi:hypothetical protein